MTPRPDNFLRVSTAIKQRKDGWINTWVYVGCNYRWTKPVIACTSLNNIFAFSNNYGYFRRWVHYLQEVRARFGLSSDYAFRTPSTGIFVRTSSICLLFRQRFRAHSMIRTRTYILWRTTMERGSNGSFRVSYQYAP